MVDVVVLGAGGVLGQHLIEYKPKEVEAVFYKRTPFSAFKGIDAQSKYALLKMLNSELPSVVINLAGENRVDVVEQHPKWFIPINAEVPGWIAQWCDTHNAHLIQVSTQGIFSGDNATYHPYDNPHPITEYGKQKVKAEDNVKRYKNWTIARSTFVLGVRLFSDIGRANPIENMLSASEQLQVNDRWFSPAFAKDVALQLWKLAEQKPRDIVHIGIPIRTNRYEIARKVYEGLNIPIQRNIYPVSHSHFPGIAPRPIDTTWAEGSLYSMSMSDGIRDIIRSWTS